jgi:hypothetical protein
LAWSVGGCKTVEPAASILPTIHPTRSDAAVVFAYTKQGKSGVYRVNTRTAVVTEVVPPQNGLIYEPCPSRDGKSVWYLLLETVDNRYRYAVATTDTADATVRKVFESTTPITSLAVSERTRRLYFASAREAGRSSPVGTNAFRVMELFSVTRDGRDVRKESAFGAYQIRGGLAFDASEENLFLNISFARKDQVDGPYRYHLRDQTLTYLARTEGKPAPGQPRARRPVKYQFADFLQPAPSRDGHVVYLKDSYRVYALPNGSNSPRLLYQQSEEERGYGHGIVGVATLNTDNGVLVHRQTSTGAPFVIVSETGSVREIPVDMARFEHHYAK